MATTRPLHYISMLLLVVNKIYFRHSYSSHEDFVQLFIIIRLLVVARSAPVEQDNLVEVVDQAEVRRKYVAKDLRNVSH